LKENKTLITIGSVLFAGAITRRMLNSIGGIRSLPYLVQILITLLVPSILFVVVRKEKNE
jgi:hypothetical protein